MDEKQPYSGKAPLHIVSEQKKQFDLEIAQLLIRYGSSVDVLDREGKTPLRYAVESGHSDMVKFLLRQGADPFTRGLMRFKDFLDTTLKACVCQTRLAASVLKSNLESPLAVAIAGRNFDAARSILILGGQPIVPSSAVADPDSAKATLASPILRALKEICHAFYDANFFRHLKKMNRLFQQIVASGYPLGRETWLDQDFSDLR